MDALPWTALTFLDSDMPSRVLSVMSVFRFGLRSQNNGCQLRSTMGVVWKHSSFQCMCLGSCLRRGFHPTPGCPMAQDARNPFRGGHSDFWTIPGHPGARDPDISSPRAELWLSAMCHWSFLEPFPRKNSQH